jgi:hypothetical protein
MRGSAGTGIMSRLNPRCRAYSRISSAYETTSVPPISIVRLSDPGRFSAARSQ